MSEVEAKMIERLRAVLSIHGGHSLTNGEGHELWSTKAPVNVTALARHAIHEYEQAALSQPSVGLKATDIEATIWRRLVHSMQSNLGMKETAKLIYTDISAQVKANEHELIELVCEVFRSFDTHYTITKRVKP